jgi:hypothetical protein
MRPQMINTKRENYGGDCGRQGSQGIRERRKGREAKADAQRSRVHDANAARAAPKQPRQSDCTSILKATQCDCPSIPRWQDASEALGSSVRRMVSTQPPREVSSISKKSWANLPCFPCYPEGGIIRDNLEEDLRAITSRLSHQSPDLTLLEHCHACGLGHNASWNHLSEVLAQLVSQVRE